MYILLYIVIFIFIFILFQSSLLRILRQSPGNTIALVQGITLTLWKSFYCLIVVTAVQYSGLLVRQSVAGLLLFSILYFYLVEVF